ncbi:MAG TPA: GNAT family N-acetyltransferase [Actinomycetota bacterium]|nr:GNAT family N-acetyltransferase [Actinomycetota bacterium]
MLTSTRLEGRRCSIRPLVKRDAIALLDVRVQNRAFLEPFEPRRQESFYTLDTQRRQIDLAQQQWDEDLGFAFGVFGPRDGLIGRVALSNVVRGAWQNATLGYFVVESECGRGIATEAVGLAVRFAFADAALHRVQAGVMPRNRASARVLEKNGFRHEGMSPRYLNINGVWEDHEMYALTAEEWSPEP